MRLKSIEKKIKTPEKLLLFAQKILKHKKILLKIMVTRKYKSYEMSRLIFARYRLYKQIYNMDLKRYRRIDGKKTLVKVYLKKLTSKQIWKVLAVAIEIEGEKLRTIKNEEMINAMLENAMKNEKFRQF